MLAFLTLLAHPLLVLADAAICPSPPRPIASPTHADAVYFLFVIDNSWPEHKIAQQKALYQMIACEIPRSAKFRVGTVYAYAPKRPKDFVLDEKSLATADRFTTTLDDVIERSYLSRPRLPHDRSRCTRMHAVVEVMRLADFSYDSTVHTHYIFPTDDSEDEFVNDCDPAWLFKQSARNILNEATPNHLYFDIIRIGSARRWTQYGERVQLADWTDRSINQRNVSYLFAGFLDCALTGEAANDVIVLGTNGLERNERPKRLMTFITEPTPAPLPPSTTAPSTTTTSTPSTITSTAVSTTTTTVPTTAAATTSAATTAAATTTITITTTAAATTSAAAAAALPPKRGRKSSRRTAGEQREEDAVPALLASGEESKHRPRRNPSEEARNRTKSDPESDGKHVLFGYQTPFSTTVFYIIVVVTTVVSILIVWIVCGLVFYCCYRDDNSLKKHDKKEAEEEDEMLLISGLSETERAKPSSIMISDHLRKVKKEKYNEEQMRSSESRGTISIEA